MDLNNSPYYNHKTLETKNLVNPKFPRIIENHRSSDSIFQSHDAVNLHNIYNSFLVNPYPKRTKNIFVFDNRNNQFKENESKKASRYEQITSNFDNFQKINQNNSEVNDKENNFIQPMNTERFEKKEDLQINKESQYQQIRLNKTPEKQNYINPIYNQEFKESNEIQYQKLNFRTPYKNSISNRVVVNNSKSNLNPRTIYENELTKNNYINYSGNKEIYKGLPIIKDSNKNKEYISPIITKIAKKNYLNPNPYSIKEETLGPSVLQINPILYPIDSYKFDFERYIKRDYLKKFN